MSDDTKEFPYSEKYNVKTSKFLTPFQRKVLLKNIQVSLPPKYHLRIEIMLLADQGKSPTEICQILGCSYHMARYWVGVAKAGLAHQWEEQPIGRPKSVNKQYLARLQELVSHSPGEYGYPFQHWKAQWLSQHLASELGIKITKRHINRLLKQMGLSTQQQNNSLIQKTDDIPDSEITISELQLPCEPSCQWSLNFIK